MVSSYTIKHSPEFSALVAALPEQAWAELADVYRTLARGPLPGQSLLAVEPYSAVPNTYTVPFRGGLLVYLVPPGKRSSAWWTWWEFSRRAAPLGLRSRHARYGQGIPGRSWSIAVITRPSTASSPTRRRWGDRPAFNARAAGGDECRLVGTRASQVAGAGRHTTSAPTARSPTARSPVLRPTSR